MKGFIWIFALMLTIAITTHQLVSGPAYPLSTAVNTGIRKFPVKLYRSYTGSTPCPVTLRIPDIGVKGSLYYRKYPSSDEMTKTDLKRGGDQLVGFLPNLPPNSRLEYRVELIKDGTPLKIGTGTPVVIRFTGEVPELILKIHFLLMFFVLFLSNIAGLLALFKIRSFKKLAAVFVPILCIGGLISSLVVQKYSINFWWTGAPFSWDLTENAILIITLVWLLTVLMIRKGSASVWIVSASLITIAVFSVSHGLYSIQLNQETGKFIQGNILPFLTTFAR